MFFNFIIDWILAEREHLPLWLPVLIALGDGAFFAYSANPSPDPWFALCAVSLVAMWFFRGGWGQLIANCIAAIAAGFLAAWFATVSAPPVVALPGTATLLSGRVEMLEDLPDGTRRATIAAAHWPGQEPMIRTLRLHLKPGDGSELASGDLLQVRAMMRPPPAPAFPGARDLQRDAFFSGAAGSATALGPIEIIAHEPHSGVVASWRDLRGRIAAIIIAELGNRTGGIAATILTGFGASIQDADRQAFRDSGLAHLLAVAGLHVGAVMTLTFALVRTVLVLRDRVSLHLPVRTVSAVSALTMGIFYLCLTGAHVPTQRSLAMAAVVTLALLAGRRPLSLRGLALAASGILLVEPEMLVTVGFQMSFAAVLALISGYRAMRPLMARLADRPTSRHLIHLGLTSVLAGGASIPFTMAHFGQVQIWFVVANVLAVPVTAFAVMPLGVLSLLLMPLGLEWISLVPMGWAIRLILEIAHRTAELPAATLTTPTMPSFGLIAVGLGIAWLGLWTTRARLAGVPLIALGMLSPWLFAPPDILVSADGRMMALHRGRAVDVVTIGLDRFTIEQWLELWGTREFRRLGRNPTDLSCVASFCRITDARGAVVLVTSRDDIPDEACRDVIMTIALGASNGRCGADVPRLGREMLLRHGASAMWFSSDGLKIVSSEGHRGIRPWTATQYRMHPAPIVEMQPAAADELPTS